MYQNNGYLDVDVRPPVIEVKKGRDDVTAVVAEDLAELAEAERPVGPKEAKLVAEIEAIDARLDDPSLTPKRKQKLSEKRLKKEGKWRALRESQKKDKRWVYLTVQVREGTQYKLGKLTFEGNDAFPEKAPIARDSSLR
jgi:outer membrane protein assembly factor BamA